MGNENEFSKSSHNQKKENPKETEQNNNKIKKDKNNQLAIPKEKKEKIDTNSVVNTVMTNIQQNSEYDVTEELDLDHLNEYVDSIFPSDVPKENVELIRAQIFEIKKAKIGEENKINIFEFNQINNQSCFYFIMSMKKVTENTANFAYKFNIIDISVQKIGIKPKEIIEKKESQVIIKKEYQKLNGKV